MSYDFESSSLQYAEVDATPPVLVAPLTICAWAKFESLADWGCLCNIVNTLSNVDYFSLMFVLPTGKIGAEDRSFGGLSTRADSTVGPTTGVWSHCAARYNSISSRDAYFQGTNKGSDTTLNDPPQNLNRMGVGRKGRIGPTDYFDGLLAEVAIWNVALTDGEIATLAAGGNPLATQFSHVVAYWRFKVNEGTTISDETTYNNRLIVVNGAVWSSDHPTVAEPPAIPDQTGAGKMGFTAYGSHEIPKVGAGSGISGRTASGLRNSVYGEAGTGRMGLTEYGSKGGITNVKKNTNSASIHLAWDASTDPTVTGYTVYWSLGAGPPYPNSSGNLGLVLDKVLTGFTPRGTYEFVVKATNPAGESLASNEISAPLSYGMMFSDHGSKIQQFIRQEIARIGFTAGGVKLFVSAGSKTGGGSMGLTGSGGDAAFSNETGTGSMELVARGGKAGTFDKAGIGVLGFTASGIPDMSGPSTFLKAGQGTIGFVAVGDMRAVYGEAGTGYLGLTARGPSYRISIPTTVGVSKKRKRSEGRSNIQSLSDDR